MDDNLQVIELIGGCHIFKKLSTEEQAALAQYAVTVPVVAGQEIFREGDPAEAIHIVAEGDILIRRREDETRSRDVARFITGESFGEMDVLRRSRRTADAVAVTPGKLIVIPGAKDGTGTTGGSGSSPTFAGILVDNPRVFAGILHKLIAYVAGRVRGTNRLLGENSSLVTEIRRQVYTDKLTGLYNTAYLKDSLASFPPEDADASSVLFFKPDRFKDVNDTYGHDVGDGAIQLLARLFREVITPVGSAIRYRGNELVALLPGVDRAGATEIAHTLQAGTRKIDLSGMTGGTAVHLTASVAIATAWEDLREGTQTPSDTQTVGGTAGAAGEAPAGAPAGGSPADRRSARRGSEDRPGDVLLQCAYQRIMQARGGPGNTIYGGSDNS